MKKTLTLSCLFLLLFSSCITRQKCLDRFPPIIESRTDSVVIDRVTVRDSMIYIDGDSVTIYMPSPCDENGNLKPGTWKQKGSRSSAEVNSDGKNISFTCLCERQRQIIKLYERLTSLMKENVTTKTIEIERKKTWWEKFTSISGIVSWSVLIILAFIKLSKLTSFRFPGS